jgi:fluoroacetyl-CoA thioesterase
MRRTNEIVGVVGFSSMLIRPGDCAVAMGLGDLPIAATSHFLNVMESAALTAIAEFLEIGETTRLVRFDVDAVQAVGIGAEIRATATVTEFGERVIVFGCEIYDGERLVAQATMKRAVLERVSFLARTAAQSLVGQNIVGRTNETT